MIGKLYKMFKIQLNCPPDAKPYNTVNSNNSTNSHIVIHSVNVRFIPNHYIRHQNNCFQIIDITPFMCRHTQISAAALDGFSNGISFEFSVCYQFVKKDMNLVSLVNNMGLDRIECRKRIHAANPTNGTPVSLSV